MASIVSISSISIWDDTNHSLVIQERGVQIEMSAILKKTLAQPVILGLGTLIENCSY